MNEMQRYGAQAEPQSEVSINHLATLIWRRKWTIIVTTLICLALAVAASMLMSKKWRAEAQMVLIQRPIEQKTPGDIGFTPPIEDRLETQIGMIETDAMAERAIDWIKNRSLAQGEIADSALVDPDALVKSVTVYSPPESDLINVSVDATSQAKAELWANAICQAFVSWKTDLAQKDVQHAQQLLQAQTDLAKKEMLADQAKLAAYKEEHRLVDISSQERASIEQLQARDADVALAQQDVAAQQARLKELGLQLTLAKNSMGQGGGVPDPNLVLALQTQLSQLEIERETLAEQVTPQFPGIREKDSAIAALKKRLASAIKKNIDSAVSSLPSEGALFDTYKQAKVQEVFSAAHLAAAVKARAQVQSQMMVLPKADMKFTQLMNNSDLASQSYVRLQTALDAVKVEKSQTTGNVQITQAATAPDLPYRPNWLINLALGLVLGLVLSLLMVISADQFDRRVHDVEEVRLLTSVPIIGALPNLSRRQIGRLNQGRQLPEVQDVFSQARINLSSVMQRTLVTRTLVMQRTTMKILRQQETTLVTSAMSGEGVSFTAANLARSMASSGRRTILVDANLRRPSQNMIFDLEPLPGLWEMLNGRLSLDEALVATDFDNLWLLPSGLIKDNPTDMLAQPRLAEIMAAVRQKADNVVIDAPDCNGIADTFLLADYTDSIVQVVGLNKADEEAMLDTATALAATGKPTVILINRAPTLRRKAYRGHASFRPAPRLIGTGNISSQRLPPPGEINTETDRPMGFPNRS